MTTTNQLSPSTDAAGLFQIFNLPKTTSAYLFSDIIKVVSEDTETVNENSFPGLVALSGTDTSSNGDNIIDPAGLIKMLLNSMQAGKENINTGKNIVTGEKYLIKEEDLTNFLKQIGLEKPSSIAASSSDIVVEINPELLAKLAKSIKSKNAGLLKNNFVELEGLVNSNIEESTSAGSPFKIPENNKEKLTIVFKKIKIEDKDFQYAAAQQFNSAGGLNQFFTFGKLPQSTTGENSNKKLKAAPGNAVLTDDAPVLNAETAPKSEFQKNIIFVAQEITTSEQKILVEKSNSYIPEQSSVTGNPPVSVETTLPGELTDPGQVPQLEAVPFLQQTDVSSSEKVPVSNQILGAEQIPLSKDSLVTNKITVTQQMPLSKEVPVTNQAPVLEQTPLSNQNPVSKQVPLTGQATVTEQIPTSSQNPVSKQVPLTGQATVTEQIPTSSQNPVSKQVPLTGQATVTEQIPTSSQNPVSKQVPLSGPSAVSEQIPITNQNPVPKQESLSGQSPVIKQVSAQVSQDEIITLSNNKSDVKPQLSNGVPVIEKKPDTYVTVDPNVTLKVNVKNINGVSPNLNVKINKNQPVYVNPAKTSTPFTVIEGNPVTDSSEQVTPDVNTVLKNEASQVVGKLSKYNASFSESSGKIQPALKPVLDNIIVSAATEDMTEKVNDKPSQTELKNPLAQKTSENVVKTKIIDLPDTSQASAKISSTEKKSDSVISPEIKVTEQEKGASSQHILQDEPVVNNLEIKEPLFNNKKLFKDSILAESPLEAIYSGIKSGKVGKSISDTGEKNLYEVIINKTVGDTPAKEQANSSLDNKDVQLAGTKTVPRDFNTQDYDNFKREAFTLKRNIVRDSKIKEPVENIVNKGDNNKQIEKTDDSQKNNIVVTNNIIDAVKKPPLDFTTDSKVPDEKPENNDAVKVQGNKDTTSENKLSGDNNSKDSGNNNTADHKPFNSQSHTDATDRFSMPKTSFNEVGSVDKQKNIESTFTTELRNIKTSDLVDEVNKIVLKSEKANVTLHLNPEHLGKVKVIVDVVNSIVNTKIEVENESVKQFVQTNIDQLKDSLQQNGVHISSFTVSLSAGDQKSAGKFKHKNGEKTDNNKVNIESDEELELSNTKRMGYNTYEYLA